MFVSARVEQSGGAGPVLAVVVQDSGAGASERELMRGRTDGVGLKNIERRLAVQYGDRAVLAIRSAPGVGTTVEVRFPVDLRAADAAPARSAS